MEKTPVNRSLATEVVAAIDATLERVRLEIHRSYAEHPRPFSSAHEATGILMEEFEELWADAKRNYPPGQAVEAIQVAAVATRWIVDLMPQYAKAWLADRDVPSGELGELSDTEAGNTYPPPRV